MQDLDASAPVIELRNALHDITDNRPLVEHADLIAALGQPHSISPLLPIAESVYNCVMHALGLVADDFDYPPFAAYYSKPAFVRLLIKKGDLVERAEPAPDRIVVYFSKGSIKHIGRIGEGGRVRSKWGTGNLYEHEMAEVPIQYGAQVSFFEQPNRATLLARLKEWTK